MKGVDGATRPTAGVRIRALDRARLMINDKDYSSSRRRTNSGNASGIKLARHHVLTTYCGRLIKFLCQD